MDRNAAKNILENIEMVKAFAQGKTIQMRYLCDGVDFWKDKQDPLFTGHPENYRIKPEPLEIEVWYNDKSHVMFSAKAILESNGYMLREGFRKLKMRESL